MSEAKKSPKPITKADFRAREKRIQKEYLRNYPNKSDITDFLADKFKCSEYVVDEAIGKITQAQITQAQIDRKFDEEREKADTLMSIDIMESALLGPQNLKEFSKVLKEQSITITPKDDEQPLVTIKVYKDNTINIKY